jgi:hypothetical protein
MFFICILRSQLSNSTFNRILICLAFSDTTLIAGLIYEIIVQTFRVKLFFFKYTFRSTNLFVIALASRKLITLTYNYWKMSIFSLKKQSKNDNSFKSWVKQLSIRVRCITCIACFNWTISVKAYYLIYSFFFL